MSESSSEVSTAPFAAVSFDVGHTLLFPSPSVSETYAAVLHAETGRSVDPTSVASAFSAAWQAHKTTAASGGLVYGTTHREAIAFWQRIIADIVAIHLDGAASASLGRRITDQLYAEFSMASRWRIDPAFPRVVQCARERGVRILLVSNWDLRLRQLLSDLGVLRLADAVFISAEHGIEKPSPDLFLRAADAAGGAAPDRVLHVGDSWEEDVEGALRAGMKAAWINPHGHPPPTAETVPHLRNLGDLPNALGWDRDARPLRDCRVRGNGGAPSADRFPVT